MEKFKKIQRLLIANRGEICCRIIKTAKRMGIKTIGIFSDHDEQSSYLKQFDEAYFVGPSPSQQSYLNQENIIRIAQTNNIDAIHPGYGFLSENFMFAEKCESNQIVFIGPTSKAIHAMGVKSISKTLMKNVGVPIIPGYFGENQSDRLLFQEAKNIGFPVILKADYGGGGKGIRICWNEEEFPINLDSVRNEAKKAFGNEKIMVEKFIQEPKHIEVQIFGDKYNNIVTLFERDCSIQRRHQKILEEAPAAFLPLEKREALYENAKKAGETVNYEGAGTVEFMIDRTGHFYFMEMNTRLQVEHGITEMITGLDLVEWQLRVALGEPLPLKQSQIVSRGHAAEFRICAEDANQNFMPCPGPLNRFIFDYNSNKKDRNGEVRLDTGVAQGDVISSYYDPMIAKLIVWAPERPSALLKLKAALNSLYISGVKTNIPFLNQLLAHPHISDPTKLNVDFINNEWNTLMKISPSLSSIRVEKAEKSRKEDYLNKASQAALAALLYDSHRKSDIPLRSNPFQTYKWFRTGVPLTQSIKIEQNSQIYEFPVTFLSPTKFNLNGQAVKVKDLNIHRQGLSSFVIVHPNSSHQNVRFVKDNENTLINIEGEQLEYTMISGQRNKDHTKAGATTSGDLNNYFAPITGTVDKILVKAGDMVKTNQPLLIILAMKMEYIIRSQKDGKITDVNCKGGDLVDRNKLLLSID